MHKRSLFFAAFILLSLFLSSCSGLVDGIMGENEDDNSSSSKTLTLTIDNYTKVIDTSSGSARLSKRIARTISADSYKNTDENLSFWVFGNSSDSENLKPTKVSFTATTEDEYKGIISLDDITAADWYLTVAVVIAGDANNTFANYGDATAEPTVDNLKTDAVLLGRANVDLRAGSSVSFTLTTDGLTKQATIDLSISSKDGWFVAGNYPTDTWTVKAGIYDRVTGNVVKDSTASPASTETELYSASADDFSSTATTESNYTVSAIAPGNYLFKVSFANSKTGKTYAWSDLIRVLPGKGITTEIAIPNVIGALPTAPATFVAQYACSDDGDDGTKGSAKYAEKPLADSYVVDFSWTRKSTDTLKNELYYEIDIAELGDTFVEGTDALPDNDTWSTSSTKYTSKTYDGKSFFATSATSVYYDSGVEVTDSLGTYAIGSSLLAGSNHAEFVLSLGKRYYARIRAVNDAGCSDYTYVTLGETTSDAAARSDKYLAFNSATINLFRICYNFNSGTFYEEGKDSTEGVTKDVFKYFSRNISAGVDVIDISKGAYDAEATGDNKSKTTDPTVIKGSDALVKWRDKATGKVYKDESIADATDATKKSGVKYSGYKNLNRVAASGDIDVEILDQNAYKFDASWIKVSNKVRAADSSLAETAVDCAITSNTTNDGSASGSVGTFTISLEMPSGDDTWVYDYVDFKISKNDGTEYLYEKKVDIARGTATVTSEKALGAGIYTVTLIGRYGNTLNSFTFTLTVANN